MTVDHDYDPCPNGCGGCVAPGDHGEGWGCTCPTTTTEEPMLSTITPDPRETDRITFHFGPDDGDHAPHRLPMPTQQACAQRPPRGDASDWYTISASLDLRVTDDVDHGMEWEIRGINGTFIAGIFRERVASDSDADGWNVHYCYRVILPDRFTTRMATPDGRPVAYGHYDHPYEAAVHAVRLALA